MNRHKLHAAGGLTRIAIAATVALALTHSFSTVAARTAATVAQAERIAR